MERDRRTAATRTADRDLSARSGTAGSTVTWAVAWVLVGAMGCLCLTQALGWTGHPVVYMAQALTPYALAPSVPIAVVALVGRRRLLAATATVIVVALAVLVAPVVRRPEVGAPGEVRFTITHANAFYGNEHPTEAAEALLATGSDVIAITEYTGELETALLTLGAAGSYPERLGTPSSQRFGVALLSRFPIVSGEVQPIGNQIGIVATLAVRGTLVRVVVAHPLPGVDTTKLALLAADLEAIGELAGSPGPPTVVVGDFNSSRWHPHFRELLGRFTDAHEAMGKGWSASWPADRWFPAFVRLDHVLLGDGTTVIAVEDLEIPGSDHRATSARLALV